MNTIYRYPRYFRWFYRFGTGLFALLCLMGVFGLLVLIWEEVILMGMQGEIKTAIGQLSIIIVAGLPTVGMLFLFYQMIAQAYPDVAIEPSGLRLHYNDFRQSVLIPFEAINMVGSPMKLARVMRMGFVPIGVDTKINSPVVGLLIAWSWTHLFYISTAFGYMDGLIDQLREQAPQAKWHIDEQ